MADALGVPLNVYDGLIETDFGAWEGLTFAEARERDPGPALPIAQREDVLTEPEIAAVRAAGRERVMRRDPSEE